MAPEGKLRLPFSPRCGEEAPTPKQDKLQVLAGLSGVEPQVLRFGGRQRVDEGAAAWRRRWVPQDRAMVDAFLSLPEPQRKPVRELVTALVTALARAAQAGGQVWRRIATAPAMR
jgi:hypothetical protein